MQLHARFLSFCSALLLATPAGADIDHTRSMSVVQVLGYSESDRVSFGSGVVIHRGRIATNCHVIQKAKAVVVRKGGVSIRATGQRADVARDLCLLEVPGMELPAALLGKTAQLKVGAKLHLYGFPRALGVAFSQGQVRSLHPYRGGLIIETSADFTGGASGGGLFDDTGHLMGLATFFTPRNGGQHFAIPVDWIHRLGRTPPSDIAPVAGIPFWQDKVHLPHFLRVPGE